MSESRTGPNARTIDCGVQPQAHKTPKEWNTARNQSGLVVVVDDDGGSFDGGGGGVGVGGGGADLNTFVFIVWYIIITILNNE